MATKKKTPTSAKPKDSNDNRGMQLRNNELAARAKSEAFYGAKSLSVRMSEAGYGSSGAFARAFGKFGGGGPLNRGK
jgi:hypothetical protein